MASSLNLANLKTPGVYIDEISLFPASIAQVETAIPAFIGYTQKAQKDGKDILGIPTKINSMVDFREYFGLGSTRNITINLNSLNAVESAELSSNYYLFDSILMFFANGGEKCYIISKGNFGTVASDSHFTDSLKQLEKYDEPTLIVMPDVMKFADTAIIGSVQQAALDHAKKMQDRFAIFDVQVADKNKEDLEELDIENFRNGVNNNLKYGAAYYPWLKTTLSVDANFRSITLKKSGGSVPLDSLIDDLAQKKLATDAKDFVTDLNTTTTSKPNVATYSTLGTDATGKIARLALINDSVVANFKGLTGFINTVTVTLHASYTTSGTANKLKLDGLETQISTLNTNGLDSLEKYNKAFSQVIALFDDFIAAIENKLNGKESDLIAKSSFYAQIITAANNQGVVIPPSGAIAGIYAAVDNDQGVWNAPANRGINNIIKPIVFINDDDQGGLNVDVNDGKSINAIRAFTGKGTKVWGARTLAGNDNEWRYVSVRRFFIMVEESVKKACNSFVFKSNDANTWVNVQAMIENFLTLQWRAGALAGAKTNEAFYVQVGLKKTMTSDDILNGRMIIEIGMAVVRPAEFIVLRFAHKMQES